MCSCLSVCGKYVWYMFMYMCVCSVCLYKCVCMCGMSVIITIQYLEAIWTTSTPHTTSYVHVYSGGCTSRFKCLYVCMYVSAYVPGFVSV